MYGAYVSLKHTDQTGRIKCDQGDLRYKTLGAVYQNGDHLFQCISTHTYTDHTGVCKTKAGWNCIPDFRHATGRHGAFGKITWYKLNQ